MRNMGLNIFSTETSDILSFLLLFMVLLHYTIQFKSLFVINVLNVLHFYCISFGIRLPFIKMSFSISLQQSV